MHIAILQTGHNNPSLPSYLRNYPQMFTDLLLPLDKDKEFTFANFAVVDGIFPKDVDDFDGYLITGSRHGVYEDLPFIAPLMQFIRDAYAKNIPQMGICFGHQALAQALGGEVIKSPKGWGVGIRKVDVVEQANWMANSSDSLDLIYVHQDQVVTLPDEAVRLAGDAFCPNAAFAIGNHVFSLQGHPEFDKDYVHELLAIRGEDMGETIAKTASDSLAGDHEGALAGAWILSFFKQAHQARQATS
ncbi:MAG: glutamine amidotransferase-related protein [Candidatus Puniceispirillaceae bacterium]